jgi:2,5-furandicarboxylate decarboxylase 1
MLATMLSAQGTKVVIAVDDDVDIFDLDKVMWAVCTRSQADRDLIVMPRMAAFQLDPSMPERGVMTTMGIDATRPFGEDFEKVVAIPGADRLPDILKDWKK